MLINTIAYSVPTIVRGTREQKLFLKRKTRKLVFYIRRLSLTLRYRVTSGVCSLGPYSIEGTEYE